MRLCTLQITCVVRLKQRSDFASYDVLRHVCTRLCYWNHTWKFTQEARKQLHIGLAVLVLAEGLLSCVLCIADPAAPHSARDVFRSRIRIDLRTSAGFDEG